MKIGSWTLSYAPCRQDISYAREPLLGELYKLSHSVQPVMCSFCIRGRYQSNLEVMNLVQFNRHQ